MGNRLLFEAIKEDKNERQVIRRLLERPAAMPNPQPLGDVLWRATSSGNRHWSDLSDGQRELYERGAQAVEAHVTASLHREIAELQKELEGWKQRAEMRQRYGGTQ